jgi:hypothetical protein
MLACWGSTLSALTEVLLSVSSSRASSPADVFRAESVTHINKENEQFVRDYHPSLSSQAGVSVAESVFGEPVWLVGSPIAPSQSVYAGGRPIHYFPGDQFLGIPGGILTPRSPDRYNEHFDRYINPRRFLTTADLDSLRELFPEAVGVHLLIAGFLIVLFEEEQHVYDAYNEAWPLELERFFAVAYRWSARPSGWNFGCPPLFRPPIRYGRPGSSVSEFPAVLSPCRCDWAKEHQTPHSSQSRVHSPTGNQGFDNSQRRSTKQYCPIQYPTGEEPRVDRTRA